MICAYHAFADVSLGPFSRYMSRSTSISPLIFYYITSSVRLLFNASCFQTFGGPCRCYKQSNRHFVLDNLNELSVCQFLLLSMILFLSYYCCSGDSHDQLMGQIIQIIKRSSSNPINVIACSFIMNETCPRINNITVPASYLSHVMYKCHGSCKWEQISGSFNGCQ